MYTGAMNTPRRARTRTRTRKPRPKVHYTNVGRVYLDMDRRYRGDDATRIVQLIGVARYWPEVMANFSPSQKYRYRVVSSRAHSGTIGREGKLSARILERDYREIPEDVFMNYTLMNGDEAIDRWVEGLDRE